jgi:hypothetical protein
LWLQETDVLAQDLGFKVNRKTIDANHHGKPFMNLKQQ